MAAFDIEGARKAGYSDGEIADHLAQQSKFDAAAARKSGYSDAEIVSHLAGMPKPTQSSPLVSAAGNAVQAVTGGFNSLLAGGLRGAAGIGATLLQPTDALTDYVTGSKGTNEQRRKDIDAAMVTMGADPNSLLYGTGKLGAEMAGTAGVGGMLGAGAKAVGAAAPVVNALSSAGFTTGAKAAPGVVGAATNLLGRGAAGAAVGGVSAGVVDPSSAGMGAVVGGALPPAVKVMGKLGSSAAQSLIGSISPEVATLAKKAADLGIDIPADRIANSKPLNAVAAGLNYVPLSGRGAVENRMQSQLNQALSRTFGQDSENVTMALRKARVTLGDQFDQTLKNNAVNVDQQFLTEMTDAANKASRELGTDGASIIGKQVDDIAQKAASGQIDGQAAYNIKRTLDRIGQRNSPEAFYANELKRSLMGALDRSLGPTEAAAFKTTRQHYGNMLDLEALAKNGAEGDVSIARVANMKNIRDPQMQELADIAAQFLKPREGTHGSAQRATAGLGLSMLGNTIGGPLGAAVGFGGAAAGGRTLNAVLDSNAARNMLAARAGKNAFEVLPDAAARPLLRTAPVVIPRQEDAR